MTQIKNQLLFSHSDGTFQLGERPKSALLFLLYNLWFIFCTGELGSENKSSKYFRLGWSSILTSTYQDKIL